MQVPRVSTEPPEHGSSLSIPNEDPNKSLLYFPHLPSPSKLHLPPHTHTHTVFGDFGPVEANKDILVREYVLKNSIFHILPIFQKVMNLPPYGFWVRFIGLDCVGLYLLLSEVGNGRGICQA